MRRGWRMRLPTSTGSGRNSASLSVGLQRSVNGGGLHCQIRECSLLVSVEVTGSAAWTGVELAADSGAGQRGNTLIRHYSGEGRYIAPMHAA
jgi:hypothetical protein